MGCQCAGRRARGHRAALGGGRPLLHLKDGALGVGQSELDLRAARGAKTAVWLGLLDAKESEERAANAQGGLPGATDQRWGAKSGQVLAQRRGRQEGALLFQIGEKVL